MTLTMRLTKDDKHPSLPAAMETVAVEKMPFAMPRIALGTSATCGDWSRKTAFGPKAEAQGLVSVWIYGFTP
jgi:hypothetical protein